MFVGLVHEVRIMAGLKEISKACNVSMATVSRVLNNDDTLSVSQDVKDAILKEAEKLSYRTPRQRANDNKNLLKYKVGLVLQGIDVMGTDARLVSMLEPTAAEYGIALSLFSPDDAYDALMLIGSFSQDEIDFYLTYVDKLLFMNEMQNSYEHDSIMIDYTQSTSLIYEYFSSKNVKYISYFGGTYERNGQIIGRRRVADYKARFEKEGCYDPSLFHIGKMTKESGKALMKSVTEIPEAIVFGDRQTMEGAMEVIKERDAHPLCLLYENFFNDSCGANAVLMIFTSAAWMTAFRMLLERLDGSRCQGLHVFCPPQLEIKH